MKTTTGCRARVYIGGSDRWHGTTLYVAIVQEARRRGIAGATVERGIMGYGAASVIHEPHLFRLSSDLPIVVELVDSTDKIQGFLPILQGMVGSGMITVADVGVVRF